MADMTIVITDHRKLGEQIKAWAASPADIPTKVKDLRDLFRNEAIGHIGDGYLDTDDVDIMRPSHGKVHLMVPDARDIVPVADGEDYPLADFYEDVFGSEPNIENYTVFQSQRIADYAMRKCV